MWSVPYLESPASGPHNEAIAQCCAFQRLTNIPQGEPHPKAPHYRFLCWVLLFRTLDLSIDKRERLTCPLSSCKKTFGDQQYLELVNHISSCPYLERGLYDCPYCHKEESFCWELPYTIDSSSSDEGNISPSGSVPAIAPNNDAQSPVPADPTPTMNVNHHHHHHHPSHSDAEQSQLFSSQFAEFERDTFPEVFISSEGRPAHSPAPAFIQEQKRNYSEFVEVQMESSFAEFSNDTLPQTTAAYSPYPQHYAPDMTFELPSSSIARANNTHLSPRTSPEVLQRSSPHLIQLNLDPFHINVPVSPGFGDGSAGPHQMGQPASPQSRSRALSNASTIVPSHHSHSSSQLQLEPHTGMGDAASSQRSRRGSSRASEQSAGRKSSGSLPEEAEKASVQCKECGKLFTGKAAWLPSNLQRHMRETHWNAPKTRCRVCGKDFNRGHNLRHHMKAVHGEQP